MGNCSFKVVSAVATTAQESHSIRIMRDSGEIMAFEGSKFVGEVLSNFPGYGIFLRGHLSSPLSDKEELISGQNYYLLPLGERKLAAKVASELDTRKSYVHNNLRENEHITVSNSEFPNEASEIVRTSDNLIHERVKVAYVSSREAEVEPARVSTSLEVLPPPRKGVWSVKLVIDTKQLEEILSEDVNTEALIEQMRLVASTVPITPRRTKIGWGSNWKPLLSSVFRNSD